MSARARHPLVVVGRQTGADAADEQWIVMRTATRRERVTADAVELLAMRLGEILTDRQRATLAAALADVDEPAASPSRPAPVWTAAEDARLATCWAARYHPRAIASALGRTEAAVKTRALHLGLPSRRGAGRLRTEVPS